MTTPISSFRLLAAGAAATLALAACGGGGNDQGSQEGTSTTAQASTTTTADGQGDGDGASAGPGASTTAASGTPTTAPGGASGGSSAPPSAPGAAQPTKAGTYTYDTDGETTQTGGLGGTEQLPERTTLKVDPPQGNRQTSVRDMRDEDGEGGTTTTVLQYRDDGVYLESLKTRNRVSGITVTYEFRPDPPQLLAPTGAGVGHHTEFSMTSTNGGLTAHVTIDVLAQETLTIGGAATETFKVRTHTVLEGDVEGEIRSHDNIDATRYLTVREDSVSDVETAFGNFHTEQISVLRSLNPA